MPFDTWIDYAVAAAWLSPIWIASFAFGCRVGARHAEREARNDRFALEQLHKRTIDAIRDQYGIEGPILLHMNRAETEH